MPMQKDIYRSLQERLDTYSVGFPQTDSGVEIEILKCLFSIEDAEMFLSLSPKLETAEVITARLKNMPGEVAPQLESMTEKGRFFP
jgi:hypothetical protein